LTKRGKVFPASSEKNSLQCRILSIEKLSDLRRYEVLGESPPTPRDRKEDDKKDEEESADSDSP
jgi:hypothetical protein